MCKAGTIFFAQTGVFSWGHHHEAKGGRDERLSSEAGTRVDARTIRS